MLFSKMRPLRVGTDCSGIEAPIMALRRLRVPHQHEFSSEIDPHCLESLRANYHPKILFGDMRARKMGEVPDIDLYVCGFPCQPFSMAGKKEGFNDPRGTLFWSCLSVIRKKKPIMFILENVKGLLTLRQGQWFAKMWELLSTSKDYHVEFKVLNTRDYGVPQARKRLFIVGLKKSHMIQKFQWPKEIPASRCRPLQDYMDRSHQEPQPMFPSLVKKGLLEKIPSDSVFVDLSFPQGNLPELGQICPCLNTSANLWNVPYHRMATPKEYLALQGFPTQFKQVVSDRQLKKQVGNSMSVPVVQALLKELMKCL